MTAVAGGPVFDGTAGAADPCRPRLSPQVMIRCILNLSSKQDLGVFRTAPEDGLLEDTQAAQLLQVLQLALAG